MQQGVPNVRLGERFRLVRLLGEGGYGAVYEAEDVNTNQRVAVKQARRQAHDASPDMVLCCLPHACPWPLPRQPLVGHLSSRAVSCSRPPGRRGRDASRGVDGGETEAPKSRPSAPHLRVGAPVQFCV